MFRTKLFISFTLLATLLFTVMAAPNTLRAEGRCEFMIHANDNAKPDPCILFDQSVICSIEQADCGDCTLKTIANLISNDPGSCKVGNMRVIIVDAEELIIDKPVYINLKPGEKLIITGRYNFEVRNWNHFNDYSATTDAASVTLPKCGWIEKLILNKPNWNDPNNQWCDRFDNDGIFNFRDGDEGYFVSYFAQKARTKVTIKVPEGQAAFNVNSTGNNSSNSSIIFRDLDVIVEKGTFYTAGDPSGRKIPVTAQFNNVDITVKDPSFNSLMDVHVPAGFDFASLGAEATYLPPPYFPKEVKRSDASNPGLKIRIDGDIATEGSVANILGKSTAGGGTNKAFIRYILNANSLPISPTADAFKDVSFPIISKGWYPFLVYDNTPAEQGEHHSCKYPADSNKCTIAAFAPGYPEQLFIRFSEIGSGNNYQRDIPIIEGSNPPFPALLWLSPRDVEFRRMVYGSEYTGLSPDDILYIQPANTADGNPRPVDIVEATAPMLMLGVIETPPIVNIMTGLITGVVTTPPTGPAPGPGDPHFPLPKKFPPENPPTKEQCANDPDRKWDNTRDECVCAAPKYQDIGGVCTACPDETPKWNYTFKKCEPPVIIPAPTDCPAGQILVNGECTPSEPVITPPPPDDECPKGQIKDEGSGECVNFSGSVNSSGGGSCSLSGTSQGTGMTPYMMIILLGLLIFRRKTA